jgi:DNA-binding NtrC family response regulator
MGVRLRGKRIGVAIGDASLRASLSITIEREAGQVWMRPSAASLWDAIARQRPDLLIVDIDLPGLSQIDLAVRTGPDKAGRIPVLLISADPLIPEVRDTEEMPVLRVPFTRKQLLDRLLKLIAP